MGQALSISYQNRVVVFELAGGKTAAGATSISIKLEGEDYNLVRIGIIWEIPGHYERGDQGLANAIGQANRIKIPDLSYIRLFYFLE